VAGSEDQFSFMPTDTFNDDVDKFYFERDNFDRNFFEDKEDSAFASLESDFGGSLNRRQDFEDEEEEGRPFSGT